MCVSVSKTWYIFDRSERVLKKHVPSGSCYEESRDFDEIASVSLLIILYPSFKAGLMTLPSFTLSNSLLLAPFAFCPSIASWLDW